MIETLFRLHVCPKTALLVISFCEYLKEFLFTVSIILANILLRYSFVLIWDPKSLKHLVLCGGKLLVPIGLGWKDPLRLKDKRMRMMVLFTLVRKKILKIS